MPRLHLWASHAFQGWLETFEFGKYLLLQSCLAYKVLHGVRWNDPGKVDRPKTLPDPGIILLSAAFLKAPSIRMHPVDLRGSQNQFLAISYEASHRSSQIYPAQFALKAFVTWFLEAAVLQLSFLPSPAVGRKVQGKIYASCGKYTMFYVILALPILVNSFPFSHTGTANHYMDDLRGCTTGALCPKPVDCRGFLGFVNRVPPVIQW